MSAEIIRIPSFMVLIGEKISAVQIRPGAWANVDWYVTDLDDENGDILFGGEDGGVPAGSLFRKSQYAWVKARRVVTEKDFDDLREGDIIVDHKLGSGWASTTYNTAWRLDSKSSSSKWVATDLGTGGVTGVSNASYKYKTIPSQGSRNVSVTAVAVKDDRWNGTCPKCGKGTYQGFNVVTDHDGPCHKSGR